jgi:Siphovirus Gp157
MANVERDVINLRIEIEALLRDPDFAVLADDEILRADTLEGSTSLKDVLTSLATSEDDAKALRDGTGGRLEELSARKTRFGRRIDFVRALIQRVMEAANLPKIELPIATLSLRNNSQQLIGDGEGVDLPDDLVRIKREPDRPKIKEALKAGRIIPGFVLSNAPPSLVVRIK